MTITDATRSLRLITIESAITRMVLSMPIITIFLGTQAGLSLAQITMTQAAFSLTMIIADIPTGWIADVFSRRLANMFGDIIAGIGFLLYAFAGNFWQVVACEIIIGIGMSWSNGADSALIKSYTATLGKDLTKYLSKLEVLGYLAFGISMVVGGAVGSINMQLAVALTAVPFFIGAVLSYLISEDESKRIHHHEPGDSLGRRFTAAVNDIATICRQAWRHKPLAWSIAGYAVAREITHPTTWIITPLLVAVHAPGWALGAGWAINTLAALSGALIAWRYASRTSDWLRFTLPTSGVLLGLTVLSFSISPYTVWCYLLLGLAQGWTASAMRAVVQHHAPADVQATVLSVASTAGRVLYVPMVIIVGIAADHSLRLATGIMVGAFMLPVAFIGTRFFLMDRR